MTAIRFDHVDVIFGTHTKEALKLLDQGLGRAEILKRTGQVLGVEDACLDVNRGEICVLMGLSGSGKSSLLRCINGLNKVSRGKLLIEHEGSQVDIANCSPATLKAMRTKRIAMVFQKFALMPWLTVAENVGFGLEMQGRPAAERKKLIDEKLELVGLSQWRDKRPDSLSGGMQQRVGLARALANDADILLMDEAYSALDPLIRVDMQTMLLDLQQELKKTVVFITHDLDEALRLGDHIAILKDGEVVQQGDGQSIILSPADGYVTDFVRDVNRGRVLQANTVMEPLESKPEGMPVPETATLETIARDMSEANETQAHVVDEDGKPVGSIGLDTLVAAMVTPAPQEVEAEVKAEEPEKLQETVMSVEKETA